MPSWERLRYDRDLNSNLGNTGDSTAPFPTIPTDANLEMTDQTVGTSWAPLLAANDSRQGFLVQNTSQNELSVRVVGSNVSGNRLPGYGDSFSPDFKPVGAYEIKASAASSSFVLTVW
jgi:hypothetical protein